MEWHDWILTGWILLWLLPPLIAKIVEFYKCRRRRIKDVIAHKEWLNNEEQLLRITEKGYPTDWERRRWEVFIRAKGRCAYCGNETGKSLGEYLILRGAHVHHMKAISQGGDHSIDNLELLCDECHIEKHPESKILIINSNKRNLYCGDNATLKKARKSWQCNLCEELIAQGDIYYGGNYDKLCNRCYESNQYIR